MYNGTFLSLYARYFSQDQIIRQDNYVKMQHGFVYMQITFLKKPKYYTCEEQAETSLSIIYVVIKKLNMLIHE